MSRWSRSGAGLGSRLTVRHNRKSSAPGFWDRAELAIGIQQLAAGQAPPVWVLMPIVGEREVALR
jgi:hypothetical protein